MCAVGFVLRCDGVCSSMMMAKERERERERFGRARGLLLEAWWLRCFDCDALSLAVVLFLAACSTDNAARGIYCPGSFFLATKAVMIVV